MADPTTNRKIKTAFVSGATGFVGSNLCRHLVKEGIHVKGLVRSPQKIDDLNGVELIHGDLTQPETYKNALSGVDTIFHTAAVLGPAHRSEASYRKINVQGTAYLAEAAQSSGSLERFVHISTVGVLGPLPPRTVACEGTPPRPSDLYEITKLESENLILEMCRNDFPGVIARPGWVYGPGDTRTIKVIRMIARGRLFLIGRAQNKQHPVWINDLIDGLIKCATVPNICGNVYHLAGPQVMTVESLCTSIANAANSRLLPFRPPLWLIRVPALFIEKLFSLWGGEPPIDHRKADFFVINRAYSIKRAKAELNWVPKMKFADGIREAIDWYKTQDLL